MRHDIASPSLGASHQSSNEDDDNEHQTFLLADIERNSQSTDLDETSSSLDSQAAIEPLQAYSRWSTQYATKNKWLAAIQNWINGSSRTRIHRIDPVLGYLQNYHLRILEKLIGIERASWVAVTSICTIWLLLFVTILIFSLSNEKVPGYSSVTRFDCTSKLWPNSTYCGVNGTNCGPFDDSSFAFSCPAGCGSAQVLEPHFIGDQEINYRSLVIGGPRPSVKGVEYIYRGDSFLCPAAIHAGIIKESRGGCGVIHRVGSRNRYPAVTLNGISSIDFEPYFPLSFQFASVAHGCSDPQWRLFTLSVSATVMLGLFAKPPSVFFATIFSIVFFQAALASDPPFFPDFATVISTAFGRFLPAAGVGFVIYHFWARKLLHDLEAPWEKTVLYLSGCWVSAVNQYTFDRLPISRLTAHDLKQQPGAITTLLVILFVLSLAVLSQAWAFRVEGRLSQYLMLYLTLAVLLACFVIIPGLELRLHHYIIALLLLPGTSLQTRPSLLYQGLLVGMFINGIARWGFDSILQTPADLLGEGLLGTALPDVTTAFTDKDTVIFTLSTIASGFNGVAVTVNDVLYHQELTPTLPVNFNWTRPQQSEPVFFRFAFTGTKDLGGIWYGDFTQPGTWYSNGTWKETTFEAI